MRRTPYPVPLELDDPIAQEASGKTIEMAKWSDRRMWVPNDEDWLMPLGKERKKPACGIACPGGPDDLNRHSRASGFLKSRSLVSLGVVQRIFRLLLQESPAACLLIQ